MHPPFKHFKNFLPPFQHSGSRMIKRRMHFAQNASVLAVDQVVNACRDGSNHWIRIFLLPQKSVWNFVLAQNCGFYNFFSKISYKFFNFHFEVAQNWWVLSFLGGSSRFGPLQYWVKRFSPPPPFSGPLAGPEMCIMFRMVSVSYVLGITTIIRSDTYS